MHIKKPHGRHLAFRLMERAEEGGYETVDNPALDAINAEYLTGKLSYDKALAAIKVLRHTLTKPKPALGLPENMAILEDYWENSPGGKTKARRAPQAAYDRLRWAAIQLGNTSLLIATIAEIQAALKHLDARQLRRATGALNQLIRWKGINKVLTSVAPMHEDPIYITLEELQEIVKGMPESYRLCCLAAFGTGARYGELFALASTDLKERGTHVWIGRQRYRNWTLGPTKNGKSGHALIVSEMRKAVKQWIAVPQEVKMKMRRSGDPYDAFKLAASKVTKKDLTFHDLRHSYAKHMLSKGADLLKLRAWMRDEQATIELYYVSWVESSNEMKENLKRFG